MSGLHVTLYTAHNCQFCAEVRQYLYDHELDFDEVSTDDNPSAINTVRQLAGQLVVPVIVVSADDRSDIVIVGYDIQKLDVTFHDIIS